MNRQTQQLKQQQRLSPQQLLLMRMLEQPVTKLEQFIKEEVERNPLLEIDNCSQPLTESIDSVVEDDETNPFSDDEDYRYRERMESDKNHTSREQVLAEEASFIDYLVEQLNLKDLSERQFTIAYELIGCLDDSGYLSRDIRLVANDMAFDQGIEVSEEEVQEALQVVQSLDPAGVGARNLRECLSLQLHRKGDRSHALLNATAIVDDYFDLFSRHRFESICERLSLSKADFEKALAVIRSLDPKPGTTEGNSMMGNHSIIPDITVTQHSGNLVYAVNDKNLPELQLSVFYQDLHKELSNSRKMDSQQAETLTFLNEKVESAQQLISTLRQRHDTINRIFGAIVKVQRAYFMSGDVADLRPLRQKDISDTTGFDVSTVSRVVNSKYVQTDFGIISLKECFSKSVTNGEGESVATESVKNILRQLIEAEDKQNPITDEALCKALREKGFPLARRTVAKYREALHIPVARLRRNLKTILFLAFACVMLFLTASQVCAQAPMSYYDSIVYKKQHGSKSVNKPVAAVANPNDKTIDSSLLKADEMIDQYYSSGSDLPSYMWYGNNFSQRRVRPAKVSLDSLPDAININLVKSDDEFCFPVKNCITSPYGWRWNRPHRGVDILLNMGDPVRCAFAGVVRIACPMGAYGNLVVVRHFNGLETVYGHLSKINVRPHQTVSAGHVLGYGGSTGRSTGPHLHFEVRFQYECFDPEWILDFQTYKLRTHKLHLDKSYFGITQPSSLKKSAYKADKSYVKETVAEPKKPREVYYTIKHGDKLAIVADRYKTTVESIKALNPDVKKYKPGMKIRVR